MKINYLNSYPKRGKNNKLVDVFVYGVDGTEQELAEYKRVKAEQYREDKDTGVPLFFSLNYVGEVCPLIITSNGNVVADTSVMRKAANLVANNDFLKDQVSTAVLDMLGLANSGMGVARKAVKTEEKVVDDEDLNPFTND
jgi:hypothetical protein